MRNPHEFDVYRLVRSEHMRRQLLAIRAMVALDPGQKKPAERRALNGDKAQPTPTP